MLGLEPLGMNDALAMPMADVFDPAQAQWTLSRASRRNAARDAAADPRRSLRRPTVGERLAALASADFWAAAMKGQDFSNEDRLDTPRFNSALWQGLGSGPEPSVRDGKDLRKDREDLIRRAVTAPCASD